MGDRCWKCKRPFAPGDRPMGFSYDGAMITRHADCVPALVARVEELQQVMKKSVDLLEEAVSYIEEVESPGEAWDALTAAWLVAVGEVSRRIREVQGG